MAGSSDQTGLNQLLQWGIENSDASRTQATEANQSPRDPSKGLDPQMLAQLLGGPSDADRMREAMTAIIAPTEKVDLDNKMIAWDNLEQLVEQIDNANNLESLGMWQPLLGQLESELKESRMYAAWCISTAVQNNIKCQERLLALDGVGKLLHTVLEDAEVQVRKKAASAISSEVRNFQPALDVLVEKLPDDLLPGGRRVDAGDMEQVNAIVDALRQRASRS